MLADPQPASDAVQEASKSVYGRLREAALAGIAVMVPLLITLYVLVVAAGILVNILEPVEQGLRTLPLTPASRTVLVRVLAVTLLILATLLVGLLASFQSGARLLEYFDLMIEKVPGVGTVYKSFRQMSDVMLESDAENFRDVKMVEFPQDGMYTIGFETTETPQPIQEAAGRDGMRTLFLPLAPNPVMGGFLAHIPEEQIMDVDMSVEEGVRAVVTTGVGVAETGGSNSGLSRDQLEQLTGQDVTIAGTRNPDDDASEEQD